MSPGGPGGPQPGRPRASGAFWKLRSPPRLDAVRSLQGSLKLPRALCRLLVARGHRTPSAAKSFLRPLPTGLHDPPLLLDADAAATRLVRAINDGELVLVHGDYDVDGIAGAALLTQWIRALGGRAEAFVPHRFRDGYDLSKAGVDRASRLGAAVLVTVDSGIKAHAWVRRASNAGMDVIVTDHHTPDPVLPPAFAVVNPNRPGCPYPNKDLCGAGVAFKVGQLTAEALGRPGDEIWSHLDLVALATIADQVALSGENRVLARYGLRAAEQTSRPGLRTLLAKAGLARDGESLDSARVAFGVAPKINAAGRVGETDTALRLLLTEDPTEAEALVDALNRDNRKRRNLDRQILSDAMVELAADYDAARDRAVVVAGDGWHPGVIGIVASRLVERVFRPVIVVSLQGDGGRGSARSIPSFDLYDALVSCREYLDRFGGHPQAAGFDIRRRRLPAFRKAFLAVARERLGKDEPRPVLDADMEIGLDEIPGDFCRYLRYLGPFGRGNPDPVFVVRKVRLDRPATLTGRGHLKFQMVQDSARLRAIGFGLGERVSAERLGTGPVDVAFSLIDDTYKGHPRVQAKALDIRPSDARAG